MVRQTVTVSYTISFGAYMLNDFKHEEIKVCSQATSLRNKVPEQE